MRMDATEPLRRAAQRWSAREALRCGDDAVSFGALEERVNRLARLLTRRGVARGDRVATLLPNSIAHVVAEMAVLRAGAAWVAINARLATPEIAFMLEHSEAKALLTDLGGARHAGATRADVVDVSGGDPVIERDLAALDAGAPPLALGEDDVARLRYTSGTTGRPKAAVLPHASTLTSLRNLLAELRDLGPDDTFVHVAPLTHASEAMLAPAFWRGARALICPSFDVSALCETIARERVTTVFLVPTMIQQLIDAASAEPGQLRSLRTIVYGAAPIAEDLVVRTLDVLGPVLLQIYGLSECPFPVTTLAKADHYDPALRRSCGLATPTNDVRILADDGTPLAAGAVGRIAVRGPQLMREYWRDPAATAAALVDGWLQTGDVGSLDPAGYLTLVDRSDDVIISGGFNVYPREVEIVLESHPDVVEAAVAAVPHQRWGQGVGAWIVRRAGAATTADDLVAFCRERLAGYKKPVEVRFVDTLPKSSTGKLLRRVLRRGADDDSAPR